MEIGITAIGTANPPYRQKQMIAAEMVATALKMKPEEKKLLTSIYESTKIEYRYSVLSDFCKQSGEYEFYPNDVDLPYPTTGARMRVYKETALQLAISAIEKCLEQVPDFQKEKITHLITVSCTGMYAPGIDIELVKHFNLKSNVNRTNINFMGCYGSFNGIKIADAICKADPNAIVLMVSVEICTIHFQKVKSMDNIISNAIFADGAAAILVERIATADKKKEKYFAFEAFHCDLLPQHSKDMAWHIADQGFDIILSSYVPQAIRSGIMDFTQRFFQQNGVELKDIDLFAIHPGGYKILKACERALQMKEEDNQYSYQVLRQYGNMSSATVLFVLKAIWDDLKSTHANQKIFSCAFGPGLTLEAMMLRVRT